MNTIIRSDNEYFEAYCKAVDMVFNYDDDEVIFISDKNLVPQYVSPYSWVKIAPCKTKFEANTATVPEDKKAYLDFTGEEHFHTFIQYDAQIKETLKPQSFVFIDLFDHVLLLRKRPIFNPATNNFIGIYTSTRTFALPNVLNLIYKVNGVTLGMQNKKPPAQIVHTLTERQHMVLFLYLNKYSNTEISSIITTLGNKISTTRVNDHLENLKYIFQATTKDQLIEKAIALGYHLLIPRVFLKSGCYPIDDSLVIAG